jgi:hypothetical protein
MADEARGFHLTTEQLKSESHGLGFQYLSYFPFVESSECYQR